MNKDAKVDLIRTLGFGALLIYGVGDILGAGIYAVVGKVIGHAGSLSWLSFAIAMAIVFLTALTYGELSSRFPQSGGVSVYVHEAFDRRWLSTLVGLLLLTATIFSMSTVSQAFVGYLNTLGLGLPNWVSIAGFLLTLLLINMRGIRQSSITNMISTTVEVAGLIIVLIAGLWYLFHHQANLTSVSNKPEIGDLLQGAALAFFSFTGFEDLANVAEEAQAPEKNLPRAILYSLGIAGLLYVSVSWVSTAVIPGFDLSQSDSPLLDVVKKSSPALPGFLFAIIAIFAVTNTTLLNYITASRLLYGMSKIGLLPKFLQTVHKKYHSPYLAILIIFPIVFGLAFLGTLKGLASSTSAVVLTVFSFSNVALIRIKLKEKIKKSKGKFFCIPLWVPCAAVVLNIIAIGFLPPRSLITAALFIGAGFLAAGLFQLLSVKRRGR
jgi:APA family basic amino acid/polyamine antiporter